MANSSAITSFTRACIGSAIVIVVSIPGEQHPGGNAFAQTPRPSFEIASVSQVIRTTRWPSASNPEDVTSSRAQLFES